MRILNLSVIVDPYFETIDPLNDPDKIYYSPGVIGFAAVFLLMVAVTFLVADMVRRIRKVRYRAEIQDKLAGETSVKGRKSDK
jgi:hypothetical protein